MKFTPTIIAAATAITTLSFARTTQAFVPSKKAHQSQPSSTSTSKTAVRLVDFLEDSLEEPIPKEAVCLDTLRRQQFSKAIPFLKRPPLLDGELPGDFGFDPLGFVTCEEDLVKYREAEVKHGRLAMLASVGWPLSELLDKQIANIMHMPVLLDESGRAPSFLNGFEGINSIYWISVLAFAAIVDTYGIYYKNNASTESYFPGNLGFDPLRLYPDDVTEAKVAQLAEIKHGRIAMMAVLFYGIEESISSSTIIPTLSS